MEQLTMSSNLATQLREGTKKAHTMAENVGFVRCFLKGTVEKTSYRKLVASLYYVYSAIEEEMQRLQNHPIVGKIYFPELNRKHSLERDLTYYFGPNWRDQISPSPATQAYVARIHEVAQTAPELLIAHSYTRYMGDLGYKGVQIPTWDARLFDLRLAAESQDYCDELAGVARSNGVAITELSTHLQGQLVAVHPAYDALFDVAARALAAGRSVVLDATFLDEDLRARAADLGRELASGHTRVGDGIFKTGGNINR